MKAPDDALGIVEVEEGNADAVAVHGADVKGQDEPASFGLQRRTAIADSNVLPRCLGLHQNLMIIPVMNIVEEHEGNIDAPLATQHGVATVNVRSSRSPCSKKCHYIKHML